MELIKIIESSEVRWIYQVLEYMHTFTLIECKSKNELYLDDVTQNLILDNFDSSANPSGILREILLRKEQIEKLVLVFKNDESATNPMVCEAMKALCTYDVTCARNIGEAIPMIANNQVLIQA